MKRSDSNADLQINPSDANVTGANGDNQNMPSPQSTPKKKKIWQAEPTRLAVVKNYIQALKELCAEYIEMSAEAREEQFLALYQAIEIVFMRISNSASSDIEKNKNLNDLLNKTLNQFIDQNIRSHQDDNLSQNLQKILEILECYQRCILTKEQVSAEKVHTLANGNCGYNAIALGIFDLLKLKQFPENQRSEFYNLAQLRLGLNAPTQEDLLTYLLSLSSSNEIQKCLAPILRDLAVTSVKEGYSHYQVSYEEMLIGYLTAKAYHRIGDAKAYVFYYHEKLNELLSPLEKEMFQLMQRQTALWSSIKNDPNYMEESQNFEKVFSGFKKRLFAEWETKGKEIFFNNLSRNPRWTDEYDTWADESTLNALAIRLQISFTWHQDEGRQNLGVNGGLFEGTVEEAKYLENYGIVEKNHGVYLFKREGELHVILTTLRPLSPDDIAFAKLLFTHAQETKNQYVPDSLEELVVHFPNLAIASDEELKNSYQRLTKCGAIDRVENKKENTVRYRFITKDSIKIDGKMIPVFDVSRVEKLIAGASDDLLEKICNQYHPNDIAEIHASNNLISGEASGNHWACKRLPSVAKSLLELEHTIQAAEWLTILPDTRQFPETETRFTDRLIISNLRRSKVVTFDAMDYEDFGVGPTSSALPYDMRNFGDLSLEDTADKTNEPIEFIQHYLNNLEERFTTITAGLKYLINYFRDQFLAQLGSIRKIGIKEKRLLIANIEAKIFQFKQQIELYRRATNVNHIAESDYNAMSMAFMDLVLLGGRENFENILQELSQQENRKDLQSLDDLIQLILKEEASTQQFRSILNECFQRLVAKIIYEDIKKDLNQDQSKYRERANDYEEKLKIAFEFRDDACSDAQTHLAETFGENFIFGDFFGNMFVTVNSEKELIAWWREAGLQKWIEYNCENTPLVDMIKSMNIDTYNKISKLVSVSGFEISQGAGARYQRSKSVAQSIGGNLEVILHNYWFRQFAAENDQTTDSSLAMHIKS